MMYPAASRIILSDRNKPSVGCAKSSKFKRMGRYDEHEWTVDSESDSNRLL